MRILRWKPALALLMAMLVGAALHAGYRRYFAPRDIGFYVDMARQVGVKCLTKYQCLTQESGKPQIADPPLKSDSVCSNVNAFRVVDASLSDAGYAYVLVRCEDKIKGAFLVQLDWSAAVNGGVADWIKCSEPTCTKSKDDLLPT